MNATFQWANPLWSIGIFFIVLIFWWRIRSKNKTASVPLPSTTLLKRAPVSWKVRFVSVVHLMRFLALSFLILALMRPQWGQETVERISDGVDIVLAVDTSKSMSSLDFQENGKRKTRLDIAKKVMQDFIKNRPFDRLGLVVFGEEAYTQCPLTLDHGILLQVLEETYLGMAGDATAIGSAIGIGVQRLKTLKAKSKVLIVITDGENNAGSLDPITAAKIAKDYGIKIYTIGAGVEGEAPILIDTPFGPRYQYIPVQIDEETLTEVAQITGGRYFRATNTEALENIYKSIDQLEKSEVKIKEYHSYDENFEIFLQIALFLLLLEFLWRLMVLKTVQQ